MKRLLRAFLILFLVFCVSTTVGTSVVAQSGIAKSGVVTPDYIVSCPDGPKHLMEGRGFARVFEGTLQNPGNLIFYGFTNQCTNCYLVLASEGNPRGSGILGRYRLDSYSYNVSNNGTYFYGGIDGSFTGNLLQDSFWAGFSFII
jgi:hypothetical protein